MANALKGKSTVFLIFIAPNEDAAEAMRGFFENHYEFMRKKSHREGPLKLLQYSVSESPEWKNDGTFIASPAPFFEGKFPEKTGRTIFVLSEIYENENGLHHHFIESKDFASEFDSMITTFNLEYMCLNQMKVIQSLWD